jgi:hypothetical protein
MEPTDIDVLKLRIEKQIITALDFLLTDNQVFSKEVVEVSKEVLAGFDQSQTKNELYGSLFRLTDKHQILKPYLDIHLNALKE